jgi:hypothetical protein
MAFNVTSVGQFLQDLLAFTESYTSFQLTSSSTSTTPPPLTTTTQSVAEATQGAISIWSVLLSSLSGAYTELSTVLLYSFFTVYSLISTFFHKYILHYIYTVVQALWSVLKPAVEAYMHTIFSWYISPDMTVDVAWDGLIQHFDVYAYRYASYVFVLSVFIFFSSPFSGSRRLRDELPLYVWASTLLHAWLSSTVIMHLPIFDYDNRVSASLFVPVFLVSVVALVFLEGVVKIFDRYFVFHVGFRRNTIDVVQTCAAISFATCVFYAHCGDDELSVAVVERNQICYVVSHYSNSQHAPTIVLWITLLAVVFLNFCFEHLVHERFIFADVSQSHATEQRTINRTRRHHTQEDLQYGMHRRGLTPTDEISSGYFQPMTSWYDLLIAKTVYDLVMSLLLFFRFDVRTLTPALPLYWGTSSSSTASHTTSQRCTQKKRKSRRNRIRKRRRNRKRAAVHDDGQDTRDIVSASSDSLSSSISLPSSSSPSSSSSALSDCDCDCDCKSATPDRAVLSPVLSPRFQQPDDIAHEPGDPVYYDQFAQREELWFDFMADCGDGWNSSYAVTYLLAQPELDIALDNSVWTNQVPHRNGGHRVALPRSDLLIIGGDLAYPTPTQETFRTKFVRTFENAMPSPVGFDPESVSTRKPVYDLGDYPGPQCFVYPGNHDMLDSGQMFMRTICQRDYLGGYLLPQDTQYFALRLPHNWWCVCFDKGLVGDIDAMQLRYFARLAEVIPEHHRVIVMTHEPDWIIGNYEKRSVAPNLLYLLGMLGDRVKLRIAGDLHNYTRMMPAQSSSHVVENPEMLNTFPGMMSGRSFDSSFAPALSRGRSASTSATTRSHRTVHTPASKSTRRLVQDMKQHPTASGHHHTHKSDVKVDHRTHTIAEKSAAHTNTTSHNQPRRYGSRGGTHRVHKRQTSTKPNTEVPAPILIVHGGGGAFMHPTHCPNIDRLEVDLGGREHCAYVCAKRYPSVRESRRLAWLNVVNFRSRNFRFDVMGGLMYWMLVSSLLPLCSVDHILDCQTWTEFVYEIGRTEALIFLELFESNISLLTFLSTTVFAILFAESHFSWGVRVALGCIMSLLHLCSAVTLMLCLELLFASAVRHNLLTEHMAVTFEREFPDAATFIDRIGLRPLVHGLMTVFDLPYSVNEVKSQVCAQLLQHSSENKLQVLSAAMFRATLPRAKHIVYYVGTLLFYWIMCTPVVASIFGTYLFLSVNFLGQHWNEAFSSLKIEDNKGFLRMNINKKGDLSIFSIGIDRVPRKWTVDAAWTGKELHATRYPSEEILDDFKSRPSYTWPRPSRFRAVDSEQFDKQYSVIDFVRIREDGTFSHVCDFPKK